MSNRNRSLPLGLARIERRRAIINNAWRNHERKAQQQKSEGEEQKEESSA